MNAQAKTKNSAAADAPHEAAVAAIKAVVARKTTRANIPLTNRAVPGKTMLTVERPDGWWIVDIPDTVTECGPYQTKQDAEDDMRGMARFLRNEDDPTFVLGA